MPIRPNHTRLHLVLPDCLLDKLDAICASRRVHRSHVIQAAVLRYLEVPEAWAATETIQRDATRARTAEPARGDPPPGHEVANVQGKAQADELERPVRNPRGGWIDIRTLGRHRLG